MRKKLIQLLYVEDVCPNVSCRDCQYYQKDAIGNPCNEQMALADKLISNGVTIPVRCKDCKFFTEGMAVGICKHDPDKPLMPIPYNHFCSYGEKRGDSQ